MISATDLALVIQPGNYRLKVFQYSEEIDSEEDEDSEEFEEFEDGSMSYAAAYAESDFVVSTVNITFLEALVKEFTTHEVYVGLFISDSPVDFESLNEGIKKITLIPEDGDPIHIEPKQGEIMWFTDKGLRQEENSELLEFTPEGKKIWALKLGS